MKSGMSLCVLHNQERDSKRELSYRKFSAYKIFRIVKWNSEVERIVSSRTSPNNVHQYVAAVGSSAGALLPKRPNSISGQFWKRFNSRTVQ